MRDALRASTVYDFNTHALRTYVIQILKWHPYGHERATMCTLSHAPNRIRSLASPVNVVQIIMSKTFYFSSNMSTSVVVIRTHQEQLQNRRSHVSKWLHMWLASASSAPFIFNIYELWIVTLACLDPDCRAERWTRICLMIYATQMWCWFFRCAT